MFENLCVFIQLFRQTKQLFYHPYQPMLATLISGPTAESWVSHQESESQGETAVKEQDRYVETFGIALVTELTNR